MVKYLFYYIYLVAWFPHHKSVAAYRYEFSMTSLSYTANHNAMVHHFFSLVKHEMMEIVSQ